MKLKPKLPFSLTGSGNATSDVLLTNCKNCGKHWGFHYVWACRDVQSGKFPSHVCFDDLAPHQRYRTEHTDEDSPSDDSTVDITDWRVWQASSIQPGECKCGIQQKDCRYHES